MLFVLSGYGAHLVESSNDLQSLRCTLKLILQDHPAHF
jgi:hypothetical protein